MDKNNYCVIMAGGVGSRFWPLSKNNKPKQFLDILGTGKTLIQLTYERFASICPAENFFVVTNANYKNLVLQQLPNINEDQVLLEPIRRNTAPCIAYANHKIQKRNPNASIIVTPADHLILNETKFLGVLSEGIQFVQDGNKLLTLGITPSRPETGYGYIQVSNKAVENYSDVYPVKTFTEKPHLELAKIFQESGEFFWNSGIFVWKLSTIQDAFDKFLPDIKNLFEAILDKLDTGEEQSFIDQIYPKCENISIDYGILEKSESVFVYCSEFGWSDLGTWGSLYEHTAKDNNQNAIQGENVMLYESKNCLVNVPNNKLVVVQGLKDYIVVETDNSLLICRRRDEQEIRKIVNDVKITKGKKFV
ncbi:mannose-1-phosphate guanylyltransferase [Labilibaculum sp. A4]|uniref:mannose-1-phosphate guanylyltransferase n=1 Tax=Labilibaculum euxinus TaxID=2686357 RepID=UPI000F619B9C|nr:mannose-1-phosphate guanylyltransferase [Labilibaculum euxinus]MDQ1772412.1 mannose-1-phosphate guanylyltransferase [Labilibaculum euxinus]MWN78116.1 mannose-1-phosphate guanylyltransferase [Labilibaculum euxinus]